MESLLADVRQRLWAARLLQALRGALWAWAAIMATVAVLHAVTGVPGLASAVALGTAAVLVAIAWAVSHGPGKAEAALYADRHLGGQSGYSTWLEGCRSGDAQRDSAARRRLVEWTASVVPASRRALEARRLPWRLARPLAAAAICTGVAVTVTMLGLAQPAAPTGSRDGMGSEAAPAGAPRLDDAALAESLAGSMAESMAGEPATPVGPEESGRGSMDREDTPGGLRAAGPAPGPQDSIERADSDDQRREASGVAAVAGTGREAGSTRDDSGPGAGSRAAPGAMNVQRRDVNGSADAGERMADDERSAGYGDDAARAAAGAGAAMLSAAAAQAPAARRDAVLSPAEAAYVDAWRAAAREPGQEQR